MTKYLMGGKEAPPPPEPMKIDKGIPIPERTDNFAARTSSLMASARLMEVGDSIVVAYTRSAVTTNMTRATGFKFTQRREGDKVRIWRIS